MAEVYIAAESAVVDIDGLPTRIRKGVTRVADTAQVVKDHPELFKPASDGVFPTRTARAEPKPKPEPKQG